MKIQSHTAGAIAVTAAATSLVALTFGFRAVLGMFIGPINSATGLGFAAVSLALAVSQLVSGVSQPLCGALSDRFGPARIVFGGGILLALGIAMLPLASSELGLLLAFGLIAAATSAVGSTPVLLAAVNARVPEHHRGAATGIVGSGASLGQFALPPLTQVSMAAAGWASALVGLALLSLVALPLARALPGTPSRRSPSANAGTPGEGIEATPREAFADGRYWAIAGAFTACGFHIAFMLAHMPGVIEGCGFGGQLAGVWFSIMGLANMAGSIGIGFALQRFALKRILALIHGARALGIAAFLLAPKTEAVLAGFAIWMGVTYMAMMPPTAAMVSRRYGIRHMGVLFGVVMLVHQVGSFLGVWLGGLAFERYGSFQGIWLLDVAFALVAAAITLSIPEGDRRPAATPDPRKIRPASARVDRNGASVPEWHGRQSPRASSPLSAAPSAAAGSG